MLTLWRQINEMLNDALNQVELCRCQVKSFEHHDQEFLTAEWNSIERDLQYSRGKARNEMNRYLLPAGPGRCCRQPVQPD